MGANKNDVGYFSIWSGVGNVCPCGAVRDSAYGVM
jgi:hypothetical protein